MADRAEFEVELEDDVTPGARKAEGSLKRLQRAFERFNKSSVGKATAKFASMAKNVIAIGAAAAAGVAGAIASMTVGMVDFNQRSTLAFTQLAKHGEIPEDLFQRSIDLAKRFGLDIKDISKQIIKFRSLQFSQEQSEALVGMGADLRSLGASTEQINSVFLAIGKIKSQQKVQGDEFMMLAEAGVSLGLIYDNLQTKLGKTRDEILDMQRAGEITDTLALEAIGKAILQKTNSKAFGEAGERIASQTIGGMAGKLHSEFQDLFRRSAAQVEPVVTKAFGPIADTLSALFNDPASVAAIVSLVSGIGEAITASLPFVKQFLSAFGEGFMATMPAIMEGFRTVIDMFGEFGGDANRTTEIVTMVARALGEAAAILAGAFVFSVGAAGAAIAAIAVIWNHWKNVLQGFIDAIGAVVFAVMDFFANVSAVFSNGELDLGERSMALGRAIVQGVVNGIKSLAMLPATILKNLAGSWIDSAKSVLGISSPSKVFEDIGANTALGFQMGVESDMPTIQGVSGMLGASNPIAASGAGGGNSFTFAPSITVPVSGKATQADGEAFGAGLRDSLERQFFEFMEGVALADGV